LATSKYTLCRLRTIGWYSSRFLSALKTPKYPLFLRLLATPPQPHVRHLEVHVLEEKFSEEEAAKVLAGLGLTDKYDANEFYIGINVELEHGTVDPATNVTGDDPKMTAKIALAHLNEIPNYYTLLEEMEKKGEAMMK